MKGMSWISRQANFRHWRAHEALTSFDAPSISTLVAFAGWHGVVMFAPLNILDARYCYQVFQYCNTAGRLKAFKSPLSATRTTSADASDEEPNDPFEAILLYTQNIFCGLRILCIHIYSFFNLQIWLKL